MYCVVTTLRETNPYVVANAVRRCELSLGRISTFG
nr:MAG TPA: hypothetical protein [Siphoviridae sp. ctX8T1]DAU59015.1 MAG TPA: hypothetical protein [Caudoviricetes sp.]